MIMIMMVRSSGRALCLYRRVRKRAGAKCGTPDETADIAVNPLCVNHHCTINFAGDHDHNDLMMAMPGEVKDPTQPQGINV